MTMEAWEEWDDQGIRLYLAALNDRRFDVGHSVQLTGQGYG